MVNQYFHSATRWLEHAWKYILMLVSGATEATAPGTAVQDLQFVCQAATSSRNEAVQKDEIGECQFFFGICTDVQWADIPDLDVHQGTTRCAQLVL